MWKELHIGRIKSSLFGDVIGCNSSGEYLVKQILEGSNWIGILNYQRPYSRGVDMEDRARKEYITFQKTSKGDFRVLPTELTFNPYMSFLGVSGDGKVSGGSVIWVIEIKCPFSSGVVPINNMEIEDILNMNANFCLEWGPTGPQLKRHHKYYAQVQGEIAIIGLPWCDFVVWINASKK